MVCRNIIIWTLLMFAEVPPINMDTCIICRDDIREGHKVTLTEKGTARINSASEERKANITCKPGDIAHEICRRNFTDNRRILQAKRKLVKPVNTDTVDLRSSKTFNFIDHCIFCTKTANVRNRKRGHDVFPVRTFDFQTSILKICNERDDVWSREVKGRLSSVNDLTAADAVYHQTCNVNFRTLKQIPSYQSFEETPSKRKFVSGRPTDDRRRFAFDETMKYLTENDDEQITIVDLVKKMSEHCDDPYSIVYMRKMLRDTYGENVLITSLNGKVDVVTFRYTANNILHEFYKESKSGHQEDKDRVIMTAAKIIRSDIKSMETSTESYPNACDVMSLQNNKEYLPESLKSFIQTLFTEKNADVKICAIGQALIQAVRPRVVIAPLQISLAVQLHQHYASRYLIDTLHSLGFCSSYTEVQKFESSAALVEGESTHTIPNESCLQFIADNVDHNTNTLDGNGTFHGMGIMATVTPGVVSKRIIPRQEVPRDRIINLGEVDVMFYQRRSQLNTITFGDLKDLKLIDQHWHLDMLSSVVWPLKSPVPAWSGFMQMIHKGDHPGKTEMIFFPMIDLEPGNMSCVYSTLAFVSKEAAKYSKCPIFTFDQPLYWKALTIVKNEAKEGNLGKIVLRLGGFHMQMSFLGSIGHLMSGSGLEELLCTVYAPNAVKQMLSGKAVSRALRGHFLVESVLNSIIIKRVFGLEESSTHGHSTACDDENVNGTNDQQPISLDKDLDEALKLFDELVRRNLDANETIGGEVFERIERQISDYKDSLQECKTARLWLEYLKMIQLVHRFVRAERTGNWLLHLDTVQKMLPYFAASGHNLYLKSAYVYLCEMHELQSSHPEIHESFMSGQHVVRRKDRYWAGLWTDLTIEQVLVKCIKSAGGLTRGRGMSEFQRAVWTLSSPICAEFSVAMENLTDIHYTTSDQHKDVTASRQTRDDNDMNILSHYLIERDPFMADVKELRNIDNHGVTAEKNVNVENCHDIGQEIVKSLVGKDALTHVFKRKLQAVTLASKTSIKVDDDFINVDPQLLFQRLTAIARDTDLDLSEVFKYELSSIPSSLFDKSGLAREAKKSQLADAIWSAGDCSAESLTSCYFVLDGGSLLHRIAWSRKSTFGAIIAKYLQFILSKFQNCCIIFDGYANDSSTKDMTHLRRSKGLQSRKTVFNENTVCTTKKEAFLANKENKREFLRMLIVKLKGVGCDVLQADGDADFTLVKTVVQKAVVQDVALIGEDTDLLILLIHHVCIENENNIFFYSDKPAKHVKIWDIKKTKTVLGPDVCESILLLHAISGCDTTSRLYGISKLTVLKKAMSHPVFYKDAASVFLNDDQTRVIVEQTGEEVVASFYGALPGEGLDVLRFRKFVTKMSTLSKHIEVQSLPPSSAAAKEHSYRVYHQVQQWTGIDLNATEWGWKLDTNKRLIPIRCLLPAAPPNLLKVIRCNCKVNCDSKKCSCRRHGLVCTFCCGECHGTGCSNSETDKDIDV